MGGEALTLPKDLLDFSGYGPKELQALLDLAEQLKRERYRGEDLKGKVLALLFEKPSLRTRTTSRWPWSTWGGTPFTWTRSRWASGRGSP